MLMIVLCLFYLFQNVHAATDDAFEESEINEISSRNENEGDSDATEVSSSVQEDAFVQQTINIILELDDYFQKITVRVKKDGDVQNSTVKELIVDKKLDGKYIVKLFENGAAFVEEGELKDHLLELKIGDVYGYPFLDNVDLEGPIKGWVQKILDHLRFLGATGVYFGNNTSATPVNGYTSFLNNFTYKLDKFFNSSSVTASLANMTFKALKSYYFQPLNTTASDTLTVNPIFASFFSTYQFNNKFAGGWWTYYQKNYLGIGVDFIINVDKNQLWANSNAGKVYGTANVGAWNNYFSVGAGVDFLLNNLINFGAGVSLGYYRDRHYTYLGQEPLDAPFPEVRGQFKVQLDDYRGLEATLYGAVNFSESNVPIALNVGGYVNDNRNLVYRTHVDLGVARHVISRKKLKPIFSDLDARVKLVQAPRISDPDSIKVGDELVITKDLSLSGTFIVGAQYYTSLLGVRVGETETIKGVFEIGIKKFPLNRIELSVAPKTIVDIAEFVRIINFLGQSKALGFSFAKRQSFLFDMNNPQARNAYFRFINQGVLPESIMHTYRSDQNKVSALLEKIRQENTQNLSKGIQRTFVEHIFIKSNKLRVGLDMPLVDGMVNVTTPEKVRNRWGSFSNEFLNAHSKAIAANDLMAVKRKIVGEIWQKGRLFSGVKKIATTATLKKVYTIGSGVQTKFFSDITLQTTASDSSVNGTEEFRMVFFLNRLFKTHFNYPKSLGHHHARSVVLERKLTHENIRDLIAPENKKNFRRAIIRANHGIPTHHLTVLSNPATEALIDMPVEQVEKLASKLGLFDRKLPLTAGGAEAFLHRLREDKIPAKMSKTVLKFISIHGIRGFSFIHNMLGGKLVDLMVKSSSDYDTPVKEGRNFLATYASENVGPNTPNQRLISLNHFSSASEITKFYKAARSVLDDIDQAVKILAIDPFTIDREHLIAKGVSVEDIDKLENKMVRTSRKTIVKTLLNTRNQVVNYLDLKAQGFDFNQRVLFYKKAHTLHRKGLKLKKTLDLEQKFELLLSQVGVNPDKSGLKLLAKFGRKVAMRIQQNEETYAYKHLEDYLKAKNKNLQFILAKIKEITGEEA